jgi:hypothetical protein
MDCTRLAAPVRSAAQALVRSRRSERDPEDRVVVEGVVRLVDLPADV